MLSNLAIHKLIPPGSSDPRLDKVVGLILHVSAGTGDSLHDYFDGPSGGIESHFYIRFDGTIEQYRDTDYEADANYHANSFARDGKLCGFISVETEGLGEGKWTDAQLQSIRRLILECSVYHDFPVQVCQGPFSSGIGYHTMWGAPSDWTPVSKSCPGPNRIVQYKEVLTPWFPHARPINRLDPQSYYLGARGPHVQWLGERLVAHGFTKHSDGDGYQPGPVFTRFDAANLRDADRKLGNPATAGEYPSRQVLVALARAPKPAGPPTPKSNPEVKATKADLTSAAGHLDAAGDGARVTKAKGLLARLRAVLGGKKA